MRFDFEIVQQHENKLKTYVRYSTESHTNNCYKAQFILGKCKLKMFTEMQQKINCHLKKFSFWNSE